MDRCWNPDCECQTARSRAVIRALGVIGIVAWMAGWIITLAIILAVCLHYSGMKGGAA